MLLSAEPRLSRAELRQRLLRFSTKSAMDTAWIPQEQRLQTPDSVAGLPARLAAGQELAARWAPAQLCPEQETSGGVEARQGMSPELCGDG